MKKMMLLALAVLLGFGAVGGKAAADMFVEGKEGYDYEIVNQSSNAELAPGESAILWVKLENTGYRTWYTDSFNDNRCGGQTKCGVYENPLHLGTTRGQDRSSLFYTAGNWITTNRVHQADEDIVEPGEMVSFGFIVTVPPQAENGNYREYFAPVVEGQTWLADKGLHWDILVKGESKETYQAEVVDPNYFEYDLQPGELQEVQFTFKNTGTATWYNSGLGEIHLATANPKDNHSDLYYDSWLGPNRPASMDEQIVRPGEIGHFTMTVQAPDEPVQGVGGNRYYDEYWLVAEGKTWFDYYWGYTQPAKLAINVPVINENGEFDPDNSYVKFFPDGATADGEDHVYMEINIRDKNNNPMSYTSLEIMEQSCPPSRYDFDQCQWYESEFVNADSQGLYQKYITKTRHQWVRYKYWVDGEYGGQTEQVYFGNVFNGAGVGIHSVFEDQYNINADWDTMVDLVDLVKIGLEELDTYGNIWGIYWPDDSIDQLKDDYDWIEYSADEGMMVTYNKYNPNTYSTQWTNLNVHGILVIFDDVENATVLIRTMEDKDNWNLNDQGEYDYQYIYAGRMKAIDLLDYLNEIY